ncbi:MAG: hypothetical protein ACRBN8_09545 [Nannocystales bacterium]
MHAKLFIVVALGSAVLTTGFTLSVVGTGSRTPRSVESRASTHPSIQATTPDAAQREFVRRVSMRDRMRETMESERVGPPRTEEALALHLSQVEADARERGHVSAVDMAAGVGALERANASSKDIDAFQASMARLSAELRGEALPTRPPQGDRLRLAELEQGLRSGVTAFDGLPPDLQDEALARFVGEPTEPRPSGASPKP